MTNTKGRATPGPWAVSRDAVPKGHEQFTVYAEEGGERVATAFVDEANARLIAASPMLLELIKECVDGLDCQPGYVRSLTLTRMQAAIRAVEGE